MDISFNKTISNLGIASIVILEFPSLKQIYHDYLEINCDKPYISGYLAFREITHLKILIDKIKLNHKNIMP